VDNDLAGLAAVVVAAAGSVIAFVRREVVIGLVAASVALLALAVAVKSL
jgi:hypothetical protein